jgi:predicted Fe-Mo cluster-binding NifX family protein
MRIAFASQGKGLEALVEPRFGRAPYFVVVDTDNDSVTVISNEDNMQTAQGAGVKAAETVVSHRVDIVVSGNIGPKAFAALSAAGVKAVLWADGTVAEAVELLKEERLRPIQSANVEGHWQ